MPGLRFFVSDTTKLCKIASHTVLIFHSVAPKGICFAARHLTFLVVTDLTTQPTTFGGDIFRCTFFTYRSTLPTVSGGVIVLFFVFTCILFSLGPPGAPSFVARRKMGEKGVSRGCGPLNPRGNVLGHSDVLCANHFATVRVTRLSRAWRAPHCFHALCVLRPEGEASASP